MKWIFIVTGSLNMLTYYRSIIGIVYFGEPKPDYFYPTEILAWLMIGIGCILHKLERK